MVEIVRLSNIFGYVLQTVGPVSRRLLIRSLSTRVYETRTATASELFSLLTCLHKTTFTLPSIFSPLEMCGIKIWETLMPWHAKRSLTVAVRVSKTRVF